MPPGIYIPPEQLVIRGFCDLRAHPAHVYYGKGSIIKCPDGLNKSIIKFDDTGDDIKSVNFENFGVDGNKAHNTAGYCIEANRPAYCSFKRVVTRFGKSGEIRLGDAGHMSEGSNKLIDCQWADGDGPGLYIVNVEENQMVVCQGEGGGSGAAIYDTSNDNVILGGVFGGFQGLYLAGHRSKVKAVTIDTVDREAILMLSYGHQVEGLTIWNPGQSAENTYAAMRLVGADHVFLHKISVGHAPGAKKCKYCLWEQSATDYIAYDMVDFREYGTAPVQKDGGCGANDKVGGLSF
jgi:hypothetical protein